MNILRAGAVVSFVAMLAITPGCHIPAKFQEVSHEQAFSAYVGAQYTLKVPMHLSGVNLPPGYRKVIDLYSIHPTSPTWSGPELVTRDTLTPGTILIVESVHRCTNCIFEKERLEAQVRIVNYTTAVDRPIKISLKHLTPEFTDRHAVNTR